MAPCKINWFSLSLSVSLNWKKLQREKKERNEISAKLNSFILQKNKFNNRDTVMPFTYSRMTITSINFDN